MYIYYVDGYLVHTCMYMLPTYVDMDMHGVQNPKGIKENTGKGKSLPSSALRPPASLPRGSRSCRLVVSPPF